MFVARAVHSPDPLEVDEQVEARYRQLVEERDEEDLIREQIRAELESARGRPAADKAAEAEEVARRAAKPDIRKRVIALYKDKLGKDITSERLLVKPGRGVKLHFSGLRRPSDLKQMLQIRYRLRPIRQPRSGTLISGWAISGLAAWTQTDPADAAASAPIPPQAIREDGTLTLFYTNHAMSPSSVNLKLNEISVYYTVGTFAGNLARAGVLVALRLMFVAALGLMLAVFLSLPVTCMACLVLLKITVMGHFIMEATNLAPYASSDPLVFEYFVHYLVRLFFMPMPFMPLMSSPNEALVDGRIIGWLVSAANVSMSNPIEASSSRLVGVSGMGSGGGTGLVASTVARIWA